LRFVPLNVLPAKSQHGGFEHDGDGGGGALSTVTSAAKLGVLFPAVSTASAVTLCDPSATLVESHKYE
jgi:hypothetical protein